MSVVIWTVLGTIVAIGQLGMLISATQEPLRPLSAVILAFWALFGIVAFYRRMAA